MKTFLEFVESQKKLPCIDTVFGRRESEQHLDEAFIPETKGARNMSHTEQIEKHSGPSDDLIHEQNMPNMRHPEISAAKAYTRESTLINSYLKAKYKGEEDARPHHFNIHSSDIARMDDFVGSHHTPEDMHVFSGVSKSPLKYFKEANPHEKFVGHLPHFTSTSTNYHTASTFGSLESNDTPPENLANSNQGAYPGDRVRHILKIHVPKGTKAVSLKPLSHYEAEHEILLQRGHNIEIHPHPTYDPDKKALVWHSKIVGHNPQEVYE